MSLPATAPDSDSRKPPTSDWDEIPIPDVSGLVTEDDSPVDNLFSE